MEICVSSRALENFLPTELENIDPHLEDVRGWRHLSWKTGLFSVWNIQDEFLKALFICLLCCRSILDQTWLIYFSIQMQLDSRIPHKLDLESQPKSKLNFPNWNCHTQTRELERIQARCPDQNGSVQSPSGCVKMPAEQHPKHAQKLWQGPAGCSAGYLRSRPSISRVVLFQLDSLSFCSLLAFSLSENLKKEKK